MMKKLFLFLLLVPSICAQIDFTTTFPKIGFGDFYLMINNCTSGGQTWLNDQYYYPQQGDLGYNYLWGRAADYTFNHDDNLKIKYNNNGNMIERKSYKSGGSILEDRFYKNDDRGNVIEDNSLMSKSSFKYTYKYDVKGNWIQKITFVNDIPKETTKRIIEYFE